MKERIADALGVACDVMGRLLIALVICFWLFQIARAIARGVLP
jgi:hypothetical protein